MIGLKRVYNKAVQNCDKNMKKKVFIHETFNKLNKEKMVENRARLSGFVHSAGFCLIKFLPFRGHDELEKSCSPGLFLEVLKFLSANNPDVDNRT